MAQRYKVFFNQKSVTIVDFINNADNQQFNHVVLFQDISSLPNEIMQLIADQSLNDLTILAGDQFAEVKSQLEVLFKPIKAAGGIVRNTNGEILFIFRHGLWDLPKGKLDGAETPEQAALREVEEETGLTDLRILQKLPSTFHVYTTERKGKTYLKETFWYEMAYHGSETPVPQLEESITEVRWFRETDLTSIRNATFASIRELMIHYLNGESFSG